MLEMNTLEAIESAAVKISVINPSEPEDESYGSGIIFNKDGPYVLIMTCGHVITKSLEKGYTVAVTFSTGYMSEDFRVVTTTTEAEKEVGLLFGRDEGLKGDAYKSFCSISEVVEEYSTLYCGSYPYGINQPFTVSGRLAQSYAYSSISGYCYAYNMAVGRGSSGAAILDQSKRIVAIHVSGHYSPVVTEIKILENIKKIMKYMIRDEEYEMDDEIMLGHGEGVVKFGLPISHVKQVISEFHNRIYPCCGEEGLNCLFLHFKEEEERKRKKQERKRKKQEKKRKKEEEKRKR